MESRIVTVTKKYVPQSEYDDFDTNGAWSEDENTTNQLMVVIRVHFHLLLQRLFNRFIRFNDSWREPLYNHVVNSFMRLFDYFLLLKSLNILKY